MTSIIYDPFVVTNLPRLPSKSDVSKLCLTSQINDASSSNFDISISGSYIATFITRPSPKMIWSYALSPQAMITAMDSFDFQDLIHPNTNNNSNHHTHNTFPDDKKIFAVGITERKKNKLKFITYGIDESISNGTENNFEDENQSSSVSVVNEEDRHANESEHIKQVKDKSISIDKQITGLKFSKDSKLVYSVSLDGSIDIWKFSVNEDVEENSTSLLHFNIDSLSTKQRQIIYHKFLKPEDMKLDSRTEKVEYLLLTAEKSTKKSVTIRIFSLSSNEILEISNSTISTITQIENIKFTYDISGKLIILETKPELVIKSYELPMLDNEQVIKIGGVFSHEPKDAPSSMLCASTNRILVTKGSTVALIDIQYESLLSSLDLYSRSKEQPSNGAVKPPRNATLLAVPPVNGNTLKSKKTFALLVLKNTKENQSQIQYISIDVGLGKLRDALVSLPEPEENDDIENFTSFPYYFGKKDKNGGINPETEVDTLNRKVKQNNEELSSVYKKLKQLKESGDWNSLESHMISFLKNKPYGELFEDNDFKVYEYEKDRFVDPKFFKLSTLLLFNHNAHTDTLSLDEEHIPENALTYVLTHPLFPTQYATGLLKVLEVSPRLQRQAIVTCVNIPCSDFILELSQVENDEIFKDIINRLIDEFSSEEITQETIKIMKKTPNINSIKNKKNLFNLDKIIGKIIKLNYGYEILNSFIDSNGLVLSLNYSNDDEQLNKLISQTQTKVKSLVDDSLLLTLINQTLSNIDLNKEMEKAKKANKKKSSSSSSTSNSLVGKIEVECNKFDMMLKIGGKDSQFNKKATRTKIAAYSIDKLTI